MAMQARWGASLVPDEGGKAKDGPAFQGVWNVLAALYEVMHMQDGVNDRRLALCALHQGVRRVREATAEVERRQGGRVTYAVGGSIINTSCLQNPDESIYQPTRS